MIYEEITPEDLSYLGIRVKPWEDMRIASPDPEDPRNANRFRLSKYWAHIICSRYNQDVIANIDGPKGTGKSNFSLSVCYRGAIETAIIRDNDPKQWENYFGIRNVAIMDVEKQIDILTQEGMNQWVISDDGGTSHGARQFRSEENQYINNLLVTMRPKHYVYLTSSPDQGHLDKQEREIGEYKVELLRDRAAMEFGFTPFKLKKRSKDTNSGQIRFKYLFWQDMKVVRCLSVRAPRFLEEEYDKERDKAMLRLQEARKEEKSKNDAPLGGGRKKTAAQIAKEQLVGKINDRLFDLHEQGMDRKEAYEQTRNELQVNLGTWRKYQSDRDIKNYWQK